MEQHMERSRQATLARRFLDFHGSGKLLVLPNAWDAASARLFEEEGFQALGTTSAGVASVMGFPDGEAMPLATHLAVARCIVACVEIPLSLDMERGYAGPVPELQRNVVQALETGIVGINLEDSVAAQGSAHGLSLRDPEEQCERIGAAREAARGYGVPLVINARTDALLVENGAGSGALAEVIRRGNRYREAGADCIFVPDMETLDEQEMARLARELEAPLNVIAGRRTPPVSRLEEIGVARLSFGPRPMRTLLSALQRMAREWRDAGTYERMLEGTLSYETVNAWFRRPAK
jgi:2-methylisocitrate lyase-like PEP mutase family enzyme